MSKLTKLVLRFNSLTKDFSWDELTKMLISFGFNEITNNKTGGSRRKFYCKEKNIIINLHKPHPSPYLKIYALKQVKIKLLEEGII